LPPAADGSSSIGTASGGKIVGSAAVSETSRSSVHPYISMLTRSILRFIRRRPCSVPGRLYEMPHLANLRLPQSEIQFFYAVLDVRPFPYRSYFFFNSSPLLSHPVERLLALLDFPPHSKNLSFFQNIPAPRATNPQAQQKCLQRRSKPFCRRPIFSIPSH